MSDSIVASTTAGRPPKHIAGGDRILYQAVVADIISDPIAYSANLKDSAYDPVDSHSQNSIANFEFIEKAPRNSLIVRIVSDAKDHNELPQVAFPFFPPHLMMPVKPGERVWVIVEKTGTLPTVPYWMSRVTGWVDVDDVNYTHVDRKQVVAETTTLSDRLAKVAGRDLEKSKSETDDEKPIPFFPNGDGTLTEGTLHPVLDLAGKAIESINPFDEILKNSAAQKYFVGEPVPRFSKRPSDLVLQGSNNTLICLGRDRGWGDQDAGIMSTATGSNLAVGSFGLDGVGSGTIDIVTGRGRFLPKPATDKEDGDIPASTAPLTIDNVRDYQETNKNPIARLLEPNPVEGDPDFIFDSSRVYVSMKTSGDINFGLDRNYPNIPKASDPNNVGLIISPDNDAPYIVCKSDQIRIIANQKDAGVPNEADPPINGSIKIVKQGIPDDENGQGQAIIIMQSDGTIMIDGPKIVLGSGIEKANGKGNQLAIGLGATEPIVLGNELKDLLDKYFNDMKTFFMSVFDAHVHPTAPPGPPSPPIAPSIAAQAACDGAIADLINTLSKVGKTK